GEGDSLVVSLDATSLPAGAAFGSSFGIERRQQVRTTRGGLRNALFVGGEWRLRSVEVRNRPVHVFVRGHFPFADSTFAAAMGGVVAAQRAFWSDDRFPSYLVALAPSNRGTLGGTRYTDAMMLDADTLHAIDADMLALVSHESFHEWIGGRTVPADGLEGALKWFTEGVNDYYADRLLHDARLITDSAYAARTSSVLRDYTTSTYRDSSAAAVTRDYWTNGVANRLPYQRGRLLALAFDRELRRGSRRRVGIDAVVREVLKRTGAARLTDSVIVAAVRSVAGSGAADTLRRWHGGASPLVVPPDALGPVFVQDSVDYLPFDPGFDLDASLRQRTVVAVRAGGPADRAGLRDGMTIAGVSVYRGQADREAIIQVRETTGIRDIRFLPAAEKPIRIPRFRPLPR
ncbi:MAG: hypothetical protein HOP28_16585, partial [Gemmatimonadales bacterium]|nr:hypothetical protein [Gemmatimonadales bacterium]